METTLHSLAGSQAVIAWIFIITGILAISFALFFLLIIKYSFFKGLALVLLTAGILQISYGSFTLAACRTMDLPGHMSDAGHLSWVMLAVVAAGILLFITFFRSAQTFWKGIGLGMMIQGALSLALLRSEIRELKSYKATVTQGLAFQDKCRKKIDDRRNW